MIDPNDQRIIDWVKNNPGHVYTFTKIASLITKYCIENQELIELISLAHDSGIEYLEEAIKESPWTDTYKNLYKENVKNLLDLLHQNTGHLEEALELVFPLYFSTMDMPEAEVSVGFSFVSEIHELIDTSMAQARQTKVLILKLHYEHAYREVYELPIQQHLFLNDWCEQEVDDTCSQTLITESCKYKELLTSLHDLVCNALS